MADLTPLERELLEACEQALMNIEADEMAHGRKFGVGNVLRRAIARAKAQEKSNG